MPCLPDSASRPNTGSLAPESPGSPEVAILMGCYFGQDYLAAQLDSIQAQSYRHWKVWAADDGSTDATPELLERY